MLSLRKSEERGHADHGWLNSYHTFSFSNYYDPKFMGFRHLRVINEDRVAKGQGFPTHPHRDMEIISYVLEGALEHKDSLGTGSVIRPGDVQRMTAGSGVTHSEYNHSKSDSVHFLQIWITPSKHNLTPGYEQKHFSEDDKRNRFLLVASPDGNAGSVQVNQDVRLYASLLEAGQKLSYTLLPGRHAWVQVIRGSAHLNDRPLKQSDGAAVSQESSLQISSEEGAEVLLFDLA